MAYGVSRITKKLTNYYYYQELPKTMSEQTMTTLDLNELLIDNPDLLKVIPTRMKTPYLFYTAIYYRRNMHNLYLYGFMPPSMRLKVYHLHLYFQGEEFDEKVYTILKNSPYVKPPNEGQTFIFATHTKCIVCNSKTDNVLGSTYNHIKGYHCCPGCLQKLAP